MKNVEKTKENNQSAGFGRRVAAAALSCTMLFGLAGCFAAQLSQGRQQGCDVKIWNEYQYFTIRPVEDTAFM